MPTHKVAWVDTETTGLSAYQNGLIQIALMYEEDGSLIKTINMKIKPFPTDKIDQKALDVNGITKEELEGFQPPEQAYQSLLYDLDSWVNKFDKADKIHFYAYNAEFDAGFIRQFFRKNKSGFFGSYFWTPSIDVMAIAGDILQKERFDIKDFKLRTVATYLGIDATQLDLHDALVDIKLTKEVYKIIKDRQKTIHLN